MYLSWRTSRCEEGGGSWRSMGMFSSAGLEGKFERQDGCSGSTLLLSPYNRCWWLISAAICTPATAVRCSALASHRYTGRQTQTTNKSDQHKHKHKRKHSTAQHSRLLRRTVRFSSVSSQWWPSTTLHNPTQPSPSATLFLWGVVSL